MGLLNKLFNTSSEQKTKKALSWKHLTNLEELGILKEKSLTKPQVVFKYSTRCGVSRMVMKQFEEDYDFNEHDFDLHYLDLIAYRALSNEVADTFQVIHESPQVIIIKNAVAVADASHGGIINLDLNRFV